MSDLANQLRRGTVALALELPEKVYDDYSEIAFSSANALDELAVSVEELSLLVEGRQEEIVVLTRRVETLETAIWVVIEKTAPADTGEPIGEYPLELRGEMRIMRLLAGIAREALAAGSDSNEAL